MTRRQGWTLVEVVVVVMILGILAAIAIPRLVQARGTAEDKSIEYSAAVVRDAIDYYALLHGGKDPGADGTDATFKNDLAPHLRSFPANAKKKSDSVNVLTGGDPLVNHLGGDFGWLYDNRSGEFIPNRDPPTP